MDKFLKEANNSILSAINNELTELSKRCNSIIHYVDNGWKQTQEERIIESEAVKMKYIIENIDNYIVKLMREGAANQTETIPRNPIFKPQEVETETSESPKRIRF